MYSMEVKINIRLHHSGIFDRAMHTLKKYYYERRPFDCCLFSQNGCFILSVRGSFVQAFRSEQQFGLELWNFADRFIFFFCSLGILNVGYPIRFVEVARNKSITIYYNRLDSRYFQYLFVIFIKYYLFLSLFVVTKLTE